MRTRERDAMIRKLRRDVQSQVEAAGSYGYDLKAQRAEVAAMMSGDPECAAAAFVESRRAAGEAVTRAAILEGLLIEEMARARDLDEQVRALRRQYEGGNR